VVCEVKAFGHYVYSTLEHTFELLFVIKVLVISFKADFSVLDLTLEPWSFYV